MKENGENSYETICFYFGFRLYFSTYEIGIPSNTVLIFRKIVAVDALDAVGFLG